MSGAMIERIRAISVKRRTVADASKLTTIDNDIKSRCTDAVLVMLRQMHPLSDKDTYSSVARYMMSLASVCPIKCICVGISPYENGILPPFASALSYDATNCIGSTPSVQVLSQIMSVVAIMVKKSYATKTRFAKECEIPHRTVYLDKFAMMLRCSYSCLCAGVAFVNSCPMVVSNFAKKLRCSSIFSEWVGSMIAIHADYGYKLSIVSMGAQAEMSMNDCFKSFENTRKHVFYTSTVNPAMFTHMNVKKYESIDPIPATITQREAYVYAAASDYRHKHRKTSFSWYNYPIDMMLEIITPRSIWRMVSLLVDEAPERLLDDYLKLITPSSSYNMSSVDEILNLFGGTSTDAATSADQNLQENENNDANSYEEMIVNPFANMHRETDTGANAGSSRTEYTNSGQPMVNRRSAIGQLIDPQGKAVSQNVIVLDSMIKTLSDNATGYKDLHSDMVKITTRQADVYKMMKSKAILNEQEVSTAKTFMSDFMESCKTMQKKMEQAYAVAAALPQVVEGDRGIYEHETQPAAPLLRRDTGEPMKNYVYGEVVAASREKANLNTAAQTNATMANDATVLTPTNREPNATGLNPFLARPAEPVQTVGDLSTYLTVEMLTPTFEKINELINVMTDEDESLNIDEMTHKVRVASGSVDIFTCICMIVHEYMNVNGMTDVPRVPVRNMFECACGSDKEIMIDNMREWLKSTTSAIECMELFGARAEDVDEHGPGDELDEDENEIVDE